MAEFNKTNQPHTDSAFNKKSVKFRIISYNINGTNYFLGTTIMNKTISYFKNLYWKRWCIEIHFRESKYLLSLSNILSTSKNKVLQDIYSHHILFLLYSFIKNEIRQSLPDNKSINSKNLFHVIVNNILFLAVYKKMTAITREEIIKIYISLLKSPTRIDPDRHYNRIRLKPIGKWYYCISREKKLKIK